MRPPTLPFGRFHHIQGIGLQAGLKIFGEVQIDCYRHHSDIRKLAFSPLNYCCYLVRPEISAICTRGGIVLLFSLDLIKYMNPADMTVTLSL